MTKNQRKLTYVFLWIFIISLKSISVAQTSNQLIEADLKIITAQDSIHLGDSILLELSIKNAGSESALFYPNGLTMLGHYRSNFINSSKGNINLFLHMKDPYTSVKEALISSVYDKFIEIPSFGNHVIRYKIIVQDNFFYIGDNDLYVTYVIPINKKKRNGKGNIQVVSNICKLTVY